MPELSVIIVNWNTRELLARCLGSLVPEVEGIDAEILVIDNGSTDGSRELIARHPGVVSIENPTNRGYAAAVNQGLERATASRVLLLGSDVEVRKGSVRRLLARLDSLDECYAAVAPQLRNEDGSIQPSCRGLPTPGAILADMTRLHRILPRSRIWGAYRLTYWDHDDERDVVQPQMSALLLRREALDRVGPLDAEAFPIYFNDVDWCARAHRLGLRIRFDPSATMTHGYGKTTCKLGARRKVVWREAFVRYHERWHGGLVRLPVRWLLRCLTLMWAKTGG